MSTDLTPDVPPDDATTSATPSGDQATRWLVWTVSNGALAIITGLLVAGVMTVTDTARKVLALLTLLIFTVLIGSSVAMYVRLKKLAAAFAYMRSRHLDSDAEVAARLQRVGIKHIAEKLGSGDWSPDAIMLRAQHNVRFLGVFAHKWVMDARRQDMFRSMLTRIQLNGGRVQFLLLDPDSPAAQRLAMFRKQDPNHYKGFGSIDYLHKLHGEYDCFEYRLFRHFPFLRMSFVDGDCALSRFKVHESADETLNAAQLVFAPEAQYGNWTLHQGLQLLFDHLWSEAQDPFTPPATGVASGVAIREVPPRLVASADIHADLRAEAGR